LLYEEALSLRQRSSVRVDDSGIQPVIGQADARLLGHAVRNLLDNAARYARTRVALSCREDAGCIVITVSDDGPGIPVEDRERVFGRFVRLEEGRSRENGSTGLGLPVVRGIVERMGGRVYFAEPELGGATAIIELPVE
jgi:signal transduction histidine kinase